MHIKSIETRYAGITLRSRLEARWCVFFDNAGITWEYEPDRISLENGGTYLPDFMLTFVNLPPVYVEVKGAEEKLDKPYLIRAALELDVLVILGPIPDCRKGIIGWNGLVNEADTGMALLQLWADLESPVRALHVVDVAPEPCIWTQAPIIDAAIRCSRTCPYDAARGARFEHGQCGRV